MSATQSLSRGYGSFFWGCTKFAVSPYTNTFMAIAREGNGRGAEGLENVVAAAAVCGILTFVVPVLPVITTFTLALASIAMLLAAASMFLTYPLAVLADTCDSSWENELQLGF
ncbi:hypothetical protein [Legionella maioricensis]|uniref:Uncharacterized protein n=1 Tax=Legionella maioricensis TaxID=2896528 RepID=A0A9X2ICC8_9GAMM|nr:hypothetical protein [Legionella maioricensis]MCL9684277.1 hypothetical protein [Legionella maioricensis]MCL9687143.1 hypothetical protein [Legionella maioricensis]